MDVGAITRFLHCMRWMWVQLLGFLIVCDECGCDYHIFTLYAMDVGAITTFLHCMHRMRWMWVQLLRFYIVCDGCGCNY